MTKDEIRKDITSKLTPYINGAIIALDELGHGEYCEEAKNDGKNLIEYIVNLIPENEVTDTQAEKI